MSADGETAVTFLVQAVWRESIGWQQEAGWAGSGDALVAVVVALRRMPGRASVRHYLTAVGLVAALVCVLLVAGLPAPAG